MTSRVAWEVFDDPAGLATGAAALIADTLAESIVEHGRASLVLAGGGTPEATYRALAELPVEWSRVDLFQGDERCVPPDDPASNYGMVRQALLAPAGVPLGNVWRIEGERGAPAAAAAYECRLRERFVADLPRFDIVLLGVGADGHVASLFPGRRVSGGDHWVAAVEPPSPGPGRVTLELAPLAAARRICFLVSGRHKAEVVERIRSGTGSDLPAARVAARAGAVIWLLDRAAAPGVV